jgi:hypothetical protein
VQHHPGAGGYEEQRQVLQQPVGCAAQLVRHRAAYRQRGEQQAHADHRAGHRQGEELGDDFADELIDEEEGEGANHEQAFIRTANWGCWMNCRTVCTVTRTYKAPRHGYD